MEERKPGSFEAEGVCPVYCGENSRQDALDYAQQGMSYGRCDIQVLDENWNVVETITKEDLKPVVRRGQRLLSVRTINGQRRSASKRLSSRSKGSRLEPKK